MMKRNGSLQLIPSKWILKKKLVDTLCLLNFAESYLAYGT